MIRDLQEEILSLKKKKGIYILAHSYMTEDICEVADFVGDSYALSVRAKAAEEDTIVMCGVRFMAETCKILSPRKKVILSHPLAGCPMAEQMSVEYITEKKKEYPGYAVVSYINTTAALKAISDVCVTSSSAVKICRNIPETDILFIPDTNLGSFVRSSVPEKNIVLLNGGCPIHSQITEGDALFAKAAHPGALLLVHPECRPEVVRLADFVGSTAEIMNFAKGSDKKEFIIGTENSIAAHLQMACRDKTFHVLSRDMVCRNMKLSTLTDVYNCVSGVGGEEVEVDESIRPAALRSIEKMIEYGG
ncbi:MAG: quinolinate synthase NadA [Clostridia bacterium]|nr:quinolinate synthase NadA [Clostridia bacterium]